MTEGLPSGFAPIELIRESPRRAYRAVEEATRRTVHLKEARDRQSALREARILRRVRSPWTPTLVGVSRIDNRFWVATTWVDGASLRKASAADSTSQWPADLLRALCHLHRHGVVHGDIKPGNVLHEPDGWLVVVDFDFACRSGEDVSFAEAGGTVGFVAPERLAGWPADPRSDLYSYAKTVRALGAASPELATLITALCIEQPAERPPSAEEILPDVAVASGPGIIPEPDLAFAGWHQQPITLDRLSLGLSLYVGCDRLVASRLARELLHASGGRREVAAPDKAISGATAVSAWLSSPASTSSPAITRGRGPAASRSRCLAKRWNRRSHAPHSAR